MTPNQGKNLTIEINNELFYRYPIKTHIITAGDDIFSVARKYLKDIVRREDLIAVSKKMLSITQNRICKPEKINPTKLAHFLSNCVKKTPHGSRLGTPEAMQIAIDEVGKLRIIFAAILSAITKPLKIKGVFYKAAGKKISALEGSETALDSPVIANYCVKPPEDPNETAQELSNIFGCQAVILDACDLAAEVLGASEGVNKEIVKKIFADNPMGQSDEQTPLCVVRRERPGEEL